MTIKGINIYSRSTDLLGRQLTNPSYTKYPENSISSFDINPREFFPEQNWISPNTLILSKQKFKWVVDKYGYGITAENIFGHSVEAWYFANTMCPLPSGIDEAQVGQMSIHVNPLVKHIKNYGPIYYQVPHDKKEEIMEKLIFCKFKTYPFLIEEINTRGGLDFLKACSHIVRAQIYPSKNKNWEGIGEKSNFIKVLIKAYIRASS